MKAQTEAIRDIRTRMLNEANKLSDEQLTIIPEGFNNNILWNLGHVMVSHHYFFYINSQLESRMSREDFGRFGNRSSPKDWQAQPDIAEIKDLLIRQVDEFDADLSNDLFKGYQPLKLGRELSSLEDALSFDIFHEALHFGTIRAYSQLINNAT